jgi:O-glycosyl hydrolase
MTTSKTTEKKTVSAAVEAIATLVGAKVLVLKAIERSKQPRPEFDNMSEAIQALAQELEVMTYALEADALMTMTFGRDGKLRDDAYKTLAKMVKGDLGELRHNR